MYHVINYLLREKMCYLNYQKNNNLQPKLNKNILVSLDKEKIMIKEI